MPDDRSFLAILDARLAEAARAAGDRLACRPGCTECCIGPFPIHDLDALRLRRGFSDLAAEFPGAPDTGRLADCRLCFVGSGPAEIETFRVEPDPEDLEGALLAGERETIVAFALAGRPD